MKKGTEQTSYEVAISTSDQYREAGTLLRVQIRIIGDQGASTEWTTLNRLLSDTVEVGEFDSYKLHEHVPDIGKPILIELRLQGHIGEDAWHCEDVIIRYRRKTYYFPVYDWIEDKVVAVAPGKARLPQKVKNEEVAEKRRSEVQQSKEKFAWLPKPTEESPAYSMPRRLAAQTVPDLPLFFRFTDEKKKKFSDDKLLATENLYSYLSQGPSLKLDKFEDFKEIYANLSTDPDFINSWDTDEEFGRQTINGISPLEIERCEHLPAYCNITNETCKLPQSANLEQEMQCGRIYISDYKSIIEGLPRNPNPSTKQPLICPEAICLFHATESGSFLPISIQLIPGDASSIFSPKDAKYDWLLAKMYFRCPQVAVHEWIHHYLYSHAITETIAIALFRNFPKNHPLYKLLRPHLQTSIRINTDARTTLLPPGTTANLSVSISAVPAAQKSFRAFKLSVLDIPDLLSKKGLDDPNLLKNYHYRDDALALWDLIEEYVEDIINEYYEDDKDVAGDFELQAWSRDIATEGLGWLDGNSRGWPERITTVAELTHICTIIVFTSSAQHAAVNFGQFDIYKFVPNSPFSMRLPPHKKGEGSLQRCMDSLPDATISAFQLAVPYTLSQYSKDEVYLGEVRHRLFVEPHIIRCQKRFARKLKRLSRNLHRRNAYLSIPYTYLLPEKVPISVAV